MLQISERIRLHVAAGLISAEPVKSPFLELDDRNPRPARIIALVSVAAIAAVDWAITPNVSLGLLYLLPILIAARVLSPWQMVAMAVLCSVFREAFAPFAGQPGTAFRLTGAFIGFEAVGFAMSELHSSRRLAARRLSEKEAEVALRRAAEAELKAIIETSPLAILTIDQSGYIRLANHSAHDLLSAPPGSLAGQQIQSYVPVPLQPEPGNALLRVRAGLECRARRSNGEPFLAHVWIGPFEAAGAPHTAVVIWDGSDDLRDREGAGFDSLMATSRILLGAVSHELRNFVAAARAASSRLETSPLSASPDFESLRKALAGLESAAGSGLRLAVERSTANADPETAFDEAWIIMEPGFRDAGIDVRWQVEANLPRVRGDQQGLVQVLINLLRNSRAAVENAPRKQITVAAAAESGRVVIRVRDTGPGVSRPENLFQLFPAGAQTGLGLYLSRSIIRSFGGELRYQPEPAGACFIIELPAVLITGQ